MKAFVFYITLFLLVFFATLVLAPGFGYDGRPMNELKDQAIQMPFQDYKGLLKV